MPNFLRELVVAIRYDVDNRGILRADQAIGKLQERTNQYGTNLRSMAEGMQSFGNRLSLLVTAPIVAMAGLSVNAAVQQEQALAGVEASLAAMGNRAGFTAQELGKVASALQEKTLYGDEKILKEVTNTLLTFGNVTGDSFLQAQKAVLDLSAKGFGDLLSVSRQVGKALDYPSEGMSALSRIGIKFSDQTEKQIKNLESLGRVEEARGILLDAITKAGANQAEVMAAQSSGTVQLMNAIDDLAETIGLLLLPVVRAFTTRAKAFVKILIDSPKWVKVLVVALLAIAAVIPVLITLTASLALANLALANAQIAAARGAGVMVAAMWKLVQPMIVGGLVTLVWVAAAAALILIIQDIWGAFNGKDSVIMSSLKFYADAFTNFGKWLLDFFKNLGLSIWSTMVERVQFIVDMVKGLISLIAKIPGIPGIKNVIDFAKNAFGGNAPDTGVSGVGPLSAPIPIVSPDSLARPRAGTPATGAQVNVDSNITVQVPDGTPQAQADYARKAAVTAYENEWQASINHLAISAAR